MAHAEWEEDDDGESEHETEVPSGDGVVEELGVQAQRGGVHEHAGDILLRRVLVQEGPHAQLVTNRLSATAFFW